MDTEDIKKVAEQLGVLQKMNFVVSSADGVKRINIDKPTGIIANTAKQNEPGEHWTCFYFPVEGPGEFFDSLGHSPGYYDKNFVNLLIANGGNYTFSKRRIQDFNSNSCGEYCLFFLSQRMKNVTYLDILLKFSLDYQLNDYILKNYFKI